MNAQLSTAQIYTDFSGLTSLKANARSGSRESILEVARQFESMFMQIMLKSMRDATSSTAEGTDGEQVQFFQQMFDQQIAMDLANGSGIGLASVFARQLGAEAALEAEALPEVSLAISKPVAIKKANLDNPIAQTAALMAVVDTPKIVKPETTEPSAKQNWKPTSPGDFIRQLWPYAADTASSLGLQPEVLIAQAALETGWGQKMIHGQSGNSMNLFGIKADKRWQGDRANVATLEYRQGLAVKEHASFRAYDSLQGSLQDYSDFIRSNPRYENALTQVADASGYLQALQDAGYATDPAYADKITRIMNGSSFTKTVITLKESPSLPPI